MKFSISDTNGTNWLSDDDTISPELLMKYRQLFDGSFGNVVICATFAGQRRWFNPVHVVWAELVLDAEEQRVLDDYVRAVEEADRRRADAEAAAEAAREAADRARAGAPAESVLEHEVR